jgi:hypothetical protein
MTAPDAATAFGFGDRPASRQIRLISWKPIVRGQLRGFASIEILSIGLRIIDIPVLIGSNGPWATLPQKPEFDSEGRRRLDINGKPTWSPVLEWRTRDIRDKFSEGIIAAIRQAHPDDLD